MTESQLSAIRQRVEDASPGPWVWQRSYQVGNHTHWCIVSAQEKDSGVCNFPLVSIATDTKWGSHPDPQFVAHARADIPALIKTIEEQERIIHDMQLDSQAFQMGYQTACKICLQAVKDADSRGSAIQNVADLVNPTHEPMAPDCLRAEVRRLRSVLRQIAMLNTRTVGEAISLAAIAINMSEARK